MESRNEFRQKTALVCVARIGSRKHRGIYCFGSTGLQYPRNAGVNPHHLRQAACPTSVSIKFFAKQISVQAKRREQARQSRRIFSGYRARSTR